MPPDNEHRSGKKDRDSDNQNTSEEIIELHPQQINHAIGVPPVDSSTVQLLSSNDCSPFVLDHAYLPLYEATQEGNWEIAKELLMDNPELLTSVITRASDTVLLIDRRIYVSNIAHLYILLVLNFVLIWLFYLF
ncbi:hypothetical protein C5167_030135, partial [Papaver somniferum]